jgi:hypothetical protein
MKLKLSLAAFLLVASAAFAQNCESLINDEVGVIKNPAVIEKAAANLINQGATVHVIVSRDADLKAVETDYENRCPSWRSTAGRKAGLFNLLSLRPTLEEKERKLSSLAFLSNQRSQPTPLSTTFSKSSNSFLAKGDWEGGISAGLATFGARLAAYNNRSGSSL